METLNQALIDCVRACGGSKQVGPQIWPAKGPEEAQKRLLACLDPSLPAKLAPDEVVFLLKLAKDKGYHGGINHICESLSYSHPTPICPQDEAVELQKKFIEATQAMQELSRRMESLTSRPALRAA